MVGISILICCHNSARLLPRTLDHLKVQSSGRIPWEVIVVDNASTDETVEIARRSWGGRADVPLRIVAEPQLGLGNARARGFDAARHELVSCVDDDNWLAPDWIDQITRIMDEHPEVGACGGVSEAECECVPPQWFATYQNYYAIGQSLPSGQYSDMLWGAGMTIRRSIWQRLRGASFAPLARFAGEDQELSLLIRLAGWKLWIDPRLRLIHYMPANRLNWRYFRRLQRKRSADLVNVDAYRIALDRLSTGSRPLSRDRWLSNFADVARCLLRNLILRPHKVVGRGLDRYEGDADVLRIESYIGRLCGLLSNRGDYDAIVKSVTSTNWPAIAGPV